MKKICIIIALVGSVATAISAQSLDRQVIGTTGNYLETSSMSISSTVGEAVVATAVSGSFVLTQGFQQTDNVEEPTTVEEVSLTIDYSLYPNPTTDAINVEINADETADLHYTIVSIDGKRMEAITKNQVIAGEQLNIELDVSSYSEGNYMIVFTNSIGETIHSIQFTKM